MIWELAFPTASDPRETERQRLRHTGGTAFYNLIPKVAWDPFCHLVCVTQSYAGKCGSGLYKHRYKKGDTGVNVEAVSGPQTELASNRTSEKVSLHTQSFFPSSFLPSYIIGKPIFPFAPAKPLETSSPPL